MGVVVEAGITKHSGEELALHLDGLVERRDDGWYWVNGDPEPRFLDFPVNFCAPDFRVTTIDGKKLVVIPAGFEDRMEWDGSKATQELIRECVEAADCVTLVPFEAFGIARGAGDPEKVNGWLVPLEVWRDVFENPQRPGAVGWFSKDFDGLMETAARVSAELAAKRQSVTALRAANGKLFGGNGE